MRWTPANLLTAFRLFVAAPLMLLLAIVGEREAFRWVLVASFFSDAIDGTVARWSGQTTPFGAMLDSWADVTAYSVIAISVVLLWPELVRAHDASFAAIVASFVAPSLAGLLKFRQFTSYHTWLVKLAVAATASALLVLLWDGPTWPLPIAAAIAVLAAIEEIAITCVLDAPVSDLRSLAAARRHARGSR
jgi:CDP-diacylglycerol--glycerol-3-phosphate 3-phosphatidyltransferase